MPRKFELTRLHRAIIAAVPTRSAADDLSRYRGFDNLADGNQVWRRIEIHGTTYRDFRNAMRGLLRAGLVQFRREGYQTRYYKLPSELPFVDLRDSPYAK